jgi:hypothetical protein
VVWRKKLHAARFFFVKTRACRRSRRSVRSNRLGILLQRYCNIELLL